MVMNLEQSVLKKLTRYFFGFQVRYLSSINHRNLVTLLGYSQENNTQFLVYEYVPNGSVSSHLYGNSLSFLVTIQFDNVCLVDNVIIIWIFSLIRCW